jgi:mannose-6-phosphate isomerase-like protein (cupin superfamily)
VYFLKNKLYFYFLLQKKNMNNTLQPPPPRYFYANSTHVKSTYFRRVLYRTMRTEINTMTLKAYQQVGMEAHPNNDQLFIVSTGSGIAHVNDTTLDLVPGTLLLVEAGTNHNVIANAEGLSFYTVYTPPEQPLNVNEKRQK